MQEFEFFIPETVDQTQTLNFKVECGEAVFLLGANGTGKSSLMHRFYTQYSNQARRISAHRQTWFTSNTITLSPQDKRSTVSNMKADDSSIEARWLDRYAAARASVSIFDLIDAQNDRARSIANAVDVQNIDLAKELAQKQAPIQVINDLLRQSNIPIEIDIQKNEEVNARREGGEAYSIAQLSDGERNALLIAADVLTVEEGTLILVDEPERHLHRSIISPLLTELFARRPDCAFIVSTHEVMLPLDNPSAQTLLVRSCNYYANAPNSWKADLISPETDIDEELRRDILGARRKILFVEGTEQSLDKPLYSLVFPETSIVAKVSCRDVAHATSSLRNSARFHWVEAYGIVDNDHRTQTDVERLRTEGVYTTSVYSIESIYYHPMVQRLVAERHAEVVGSDSENVLSEANGAALQAIVPHVQRLSARVAEKRIRERIFQQLPTQNSIQNEQAVSIQIDVTEEVAKEQRHLRKAVDEENFEEIVARYPVRETPAPNLIVMKLGFQSRDQYESAVRKLLLDNSDALNIVRSFFGNLPSDIQSA